MRLSVETDSPFYSPLSRFAMPTINGQALEQCIEVDTEAGWAIVFVKNAHGLVKEYQDEFGQWLDIDDPSLRDKRRIIGERLKKDKIFGKVEVTFRDLTQVEIDAYLADIPRTDSESE